MNREDKLRLIFEDERQRKLDRIERRETLQAIFNSPHFAEDEFNDQFEFVEVPADSGYIPLINKEVPEHLAAVITHIGNEWYRGVEYKMTLDTKEKKLRREFGSPEEPEEVEKMVRGKVTVEVKNESDEDRTVGMLVKGYHIPVEVYEEVADLYRR